ncbi:MAG: hypothetical protein ACYC5F_06950 [Thermoleophilia bacterium]
MKKDFSREQAASSLNNNHASDRLGLHPRGSARKISFGAGLSALIIAQLMPL